MKLHYSARAERDLEAIGDWIAIDSPSRAVSFVEELRAKCRKVAEFPTIYPRVPGMPDVYRTVFRKYLIYFRVTGSGVTIAAITQGARRRTVRH